MVQHHPGPGGDRGKQPPGLRHGDFLGLALDGGVALAAFGPYEL